METCVNAEDDSKQITIIGLFYDLELNRFIDENGFIVWDIYSTTLHRTTYLFLKNLKNICFSPCEIQHEYGLSYFGPKMRKEIHLMSGNISNEERQKYVEYLEKKYNRKIRELDINIVGDEVELHYTFEPVGFERIRRITGYLVGTMDKWNDSKRAEEKDRIKHL